MRISKEISGNAEDRDDREAQGRGEYEFCDLTTDDPAIEDLTGKRIFIVLPDRPSIDTGCVFAIQGGKNRIRTADGVNPRDVYPIWHVAGLLMLPRPNRNQNSWGDGLPVMRNGQYGINHLRMERTTVVASDRVDIVVGQIDVANHYAEESIVFEQRFSLVQQVWARRDAFDTEARALIEEHESLTDQVDPASGFGPRGGRIVRSLQSLISEAAADYDIATLASTEDVLPSLLEVIRTPIITQPPSIDAIPAEEAVIKRRDVKQWRRWAVARGPAAVRFRRDVRNAYRSTCLVCGLRLPAAGPGMKPGVDSAHFLPWATFDVDHVSNGACLCKLHHWAFDEGLIEIVHDNGDYSVVVNEAMVEKIVSDGIDFSVDCLHDCAGPIPAERLPLEAAHRPNPEYLRLLKEATE